MDIKSIVLGRNSKRNKLNMSADVNATFDFGVVQPSYCAMMSKNDHLSLTLRQLVRLAPMPTPSFARIALHNKGVFVPWSDVFPAYDALLAHVNVKTSSKDSPYIPESITCISPKVLLLFIFQNFCIFSARKVTRDAAGRAVLSDPLGFPDLIKAHDAFSAKFGMWGKQVVPIWGNATMYAQDPNLSIDAADYVIEDVDNEYFYFYKLTNAGKRIVNIFQGLGYSLDLYNMDLVSFLPVLAFYKAWFDIYAPKRTETWSNTTAFKIINDVYENNTFNLNDAIDKDTAIMSKKWIVKFLTELSECFVTSHDDFVSIHSKNPVNDASVLDLGNDLSVPRSMNTPKQDSLNPVTEQIANQDAAGGPASIKMQQASGGAYIITQYSLNLLKSLSKHLNKSSVLGKRVDAILSSLYSSGTSSEFFDATKPLFDMVTNCSIDDVFNTTQNYSQGGEDLGSYAGRGIGSSKDSFSFDANSSGIFIVMSSIVPQSSYFQGVAPYLYGLTRYTLPNPQYDALGLEVTPLACIEDNRGNYTNSTESATINLTGKGFGFIPRYSGYKVHRNTVMGDMAHRSTRNSFEPYFLDRILTPFEFQTSTDSNGKTVVTRRKYDLPEVASEEFRYLNKKDYMGDFNRLFYNRGVFGIKVQDKPVYVHDDNFIVQSVFDVTQTTVLKPIEQSFDTYDEQVDDSTVSVNAE